MKKLIAIFLFLPVTTLVNAKAAQDSVIATIKNFFEGMKRADTVLLKSTLANTAILQTIKEEGGKTRIADEKISAFIDFVGHQTAGSADEQIEIGTVKIDGALASVWTPYKFFYKGKFSHCGVNSFQLVKLNNEWKIQYIIDTESCKVANN